MLVNRVKRKKLLSMDRYRGIRDDKAKKYGLLQRNTRMKDSNITLTKFVKNRPASIFTNEPFKDYDTEFLSRPEEPKKHVTSDPWRSESKCDTIYSSDVLYKPLQRQLFNKKTKRAMKSMMSTMR